MCTYSLLLLVHVYPFFPALHALDVYGIPDRNNMDQIGWVIFSMVKILQATKVYCRKHEFFYKQIQESFFVNKYFCIRWYWWYLLTVTVTRKHPAEMFLMYLVQVYNLSHGNQRQIQDFAEEEVATGGDTNPLF